MLQQKIGALMDRSMLIYFFPVVLDSFFLLIIIIIIQLLWTILIKIISSHRE